jgi:hypothetical protein
MKMNPLEKQTYLMGQIDILEKQLKEYGRSLDSLNKKIVKKYGK